jgi:hypothetical protein
MVRPEGVPQPLDFGRAAQDNTDNIEADILPFHSGAASVVAPGASESFLLRRIHGALRRAECRGGTRFHFYENESSAVPGDQVNFAPTRGRPVTPRHDGTAALAQVAMRQVFTYAAAVIGQPAAPQRVGRAIKPSDHSKPSYLST